MVVVKAAEYYIANKKILKENAKNNYRNLPEIKKEAKREYGRNRYSNITEDKKQAKKLSKKLSSSKKMKY